MYYFDSGIPCHPSPMNYSTSPCIHPDYPATPLFLNSPTSRHATAAAAVAAEPEVKSACQIEEKLLKSNHILTEAIPKEQS